MKLRVIQGRSKPLRTPEDIRRATNHPQYGLCIYCVKAFNLFKDYMSDDYYVDCNVWGLTTVYKGCCGRRDLGGSNDPKFDIAEIGQLITTR